MAKRKKKVPSIIDVSTQALREWRLKNNTSTRVAPAKGKKRYSRQESRRIEREAR